MANMPACSICSIPLVLALRQNSNALGPTALPATQLLTSALSTSTFTKKRLLYSFDRASNTGAIALHGPHLYRPISCRRDTLQFTQVHISSIGPGCVPPTMWPSSPR